MNDWCVKTRQDREDHGFVELIYKVYQNIMQFNPNTIWCHKRRTLI